jgi:hypothetical protein
LVEVHLGRRGKEGELGKGRAGGVVRSRNN